MSTLENTRQVQSDEQLIALYKQTGCPAAAEQLVSRHLSTIRGFVFQMVLNHAAADDLTQDVFLKVLRNLHAFRGGARFSTWLYQVALNTTRTYLKRQSRARVQSREELPEEAAPRHAAPEPLALGAELMGKIELALAELSPTLRGAIVLTALQGLDVKEAARIEGCTRATMYWRIHEARKQLHQRLDRYLSS